MIPKKIWFTWKHKILDGNRLIWFNSWKRLNPNYEIILMDDNDINNYIKLNFPDIYDIFISIPIGAMKADIWRYCIIYNEGGFYTDIDTECYVPIDKWCSIDNYEMIISNENDWNLCQYTFGAIPNHPALKCVIDLCIERIKSNDRYNILYSTGPDVFTDGICKYYGLNIQIHKSRAIYIHNNSLLPKSIYFKLNIFIGIFSTNHGGAYELSNETVGWITECSLLRKGFDWEFYINYYEDLKYAGIDTKNKAYNHYITYGWKEKRIINKNNDRAIPINFDLLFYVNYYEDLKKVYNKNEIIPLSHYLYYGINENRIYSFESIIHELLTVYNPNKPKKRYGSKHDGGYVLIEELENYDYFISCGIDTNIDFELDVISNYNQLHGKTFDGTVNILPNNIERLEFIKKNIDMEENDNTTNLFNILNKYNNILLKMDIEGSEFKWLNICPEEYLKNIKQLIIEIHGFEPQDSWGSNLIQKIKALDKLNKIFTLVHIHGNNNSDVYNLTKIPIVLECTYVRSDIIPKIVKNTNKLPSMYDMPNNPMKLDYDLNFEPFVFQ